MKPFLKTIGLVMVILAFAGQPAAAQQAEIELTIRAGFDGIVKQGTWVPIQVTAANNGPDFTGELRVDVPTISGANTTYTRPLDLPTGSRKVVTVNVQQAFSNQIRLDLVEGSRVALTEEITLDTRPRETLLVGVLSDQPAVARGLGSVLGANNRNTATAFLTLDDLPDTAATWSGLDVLLIAATDTGGLTPDQQSALAGWVTQGGRLLVAAGTDFQAVTAGLDDLLPIRPTGTEEATIAPFALIAGQPLNNRETTIAVGTLSDDAQILVESEQGQPLIVYRDLGAGRVDVLMPDLTLAPLDSWAGMTGLWRFILADGAERPGWAYGFTPRWDNARNAVAALPGVSLPSLIQLCGFLLVYVLLIGPVNYFILWRLKKRELAWITIPALVIVFSLMAYLTGFQLRGSQAIAHRLAVIQTYQETDTARVDGLLGVWSPRRATYDVQLPPGLLAHPLPRDFGPAIVSTGDVTIESQPTSATIRDVRVDIGAITPFVISGTLEETPRLEGDLTIRLDDEGLTLTGDIVNFSAVDFEDLTLVFGGSISELRDLPAGEVLRVDSSLSGGLATQSSATIIQPFPAQNQTNAAENNNLVNAVTSGTPCSEFDVQRECSLVYSILNGEGRGSSAYLFAWSDVLPFDTEFLNNNAQTEDLTLFIVELDTTLESVEGAGFEVPPGLMTWQVLDSENGYQYYSAPYDFTLSDGVSYTIRYQPLPIVPEIAYTDLSINLQPESLSTGQYPIIELYNTGTNRWDAISIDDWGTTRVPDGEAYIGPGGTVDLRVASSDNSYYNLERVDVTLIAQ